ncbi:MAG TPA: translocation/assembly module TamB domain-containing protein [Longimicrobiaceae bacterium]|nr:translocation/assembly module TamB domain-containing protein [Longimicrobiaceae bacterium]
MARLSGPQRTGLALAGLLIGLLLLWAGVRVYVREARLDEAALEVQNRLRLPRSAFELEEVDAEGNMRMALRRVAILDPSGDTIVYAPLARLTFASTTFSGTGPIHFDRLQVYEPFVRLVETPAGEWNLTEAFRVEADGNEVRFAAAGDTVGEDAARPLMFHDVFIYDGRALIARPVAPDDPAAARFASRGGPPVQRIDGRAMRVFQVRDIDAYLPLVRVGGDRGIRVEVAELDARLVNPDVHVTDLEGWIEEVQPDRYRFAVETLRTENSSFAGEGAFRLAEDRILYDLQLRANPLDFSDLRGLGFDVPAQGRAAFALDVESLPGGRTALRASDLVVTTPESRVAGRLAATVGGEGPWSFYDTRLTLDPLDFSTLDQLVEAEIPYEGELRGTVTSLETIEEGSGGALRIDLAASFRPENATGERSVVSAVGNVAVGGDAPFRLDGVRVEARPLHLAALSPLVDDPARAEMLRGVLRGSAVASGTPSDLRLTGGAVAYEVGDAPATRVTDLSARISTDPALRYEVSGRAAPLALATLTELYPQLPFRTATLSGPFSISGTAERANFDVDFGGAAGRLAARGTLLPGEPLRFDVSGQVEAFRSGVLLAANNPVQGPLTGTFSARGSAQDFGFDVDLAHQGGAFALGGRVRDPGDGMQFDVAGQLREFRLGTVLGRPGLFNSPLTGPIQLSGGGRQPYRFDVDLRGLGGLVDLEGWFRPGDVPSYFVTGQVAGVNPQLLPGGQGLPPGNLTAALQVQGRGTTPETFEGRIDLDARSSTLAGVPLDAARVRLAANDGVLRIDTLAATFRGARINASGTWGLTRPVAEPLRVSLAAQDLSTLAPLLARAGVEQPDLAGSLAAEGWISGSFRNPAFSFATRGTGLRYGTWRAGQLALEARGSLGPGGWTGYGNLQGEQVLLAGREQFQSVRLEVNAVPGLATFGVLARRDGESDLAVSGSLALDGRELRGTELQSLALRLGDVQWRLANPARIRWGGVDGIAIERLMLRREGDETGLILVDGRLPPTGEAELRVQLTAVDLSIMRRLTNAAPELEGIVNLSVVLEGPVGSPEMVVTGSIDSLDYAGFSASQVAIEARYAGRRLVGQALVRAAGDSLLVTGSVPMLVSLGGTVPGFELLRDEPLEVRVAADSVPLSLVSAAVPTLAEGEGLLAANLVVGGTLNDPEVNGVAAVRGGALTVVPLEQRFTDIRARVVLRGEEIRIDTLTARSDGTASVTGTILLDELGRPRVLLNVLAENFDVIDREDLAQLKVSSNLRIAGRLPEATLSGRLVLEEGTIRIPTFGERRAAAIVDVDVGEIGADTIPEGVAGASAAALFGGLQVAGLQVVVDDGVWLQSEDARIQIRGDLLVTRAGGEPRIYGDLEAVRGTYALRVGPLRREFDIERGLVQFYGTPDLNPTLDIVATNQVRTLDQASTGSVLQVQVQVGGTLQSPTLRLSSNTRPPLPESELLSYLIFGRSTANLGGTTGALAQQILAQELFGGLVAAELEQELSRSGLVDYVRVRSGGAELGSGLGLGQALGVVGLTTPTFEFGWELSNDLFLTLEVGVPAVGDQSPLAGIGLDYQINERTRARAAYESVRRDVFTRPFYAGPTYQFSLDVRHRWEWGRSLPDTTALDSLADSAAAAIAAEAGAPPTAQPQGAGGAVPDPPAETPKKEEGTR